MASVKPPCPPSRTVLVVLVQLVLLAIAWGVWWSVAQGEPEQSVGAAAAHGLVTVVSAAVLGVYFLVTTGAVIYMAVRRRSSWGRLAAVHLIGLPVSVAAVAAAAWVAATIDDQLLPRVRGTSAWNRTHAEERLRACRPTGSPRVVEVGDGAALLALDLPPTVEDIPRIRYAAVRGSDGEPSWRLRTAGRATNSAFDRQSYSARLWAVLEPSPGNPPDVSSITLVCNGGTLILEGGRDREEFLAAGSVAVLTVPLPDVELVSGDDGARLRYRQLFEPRQLPSAPVAPKHPRAPGSPAGGEGSP